MDPIGHFMGLLLIGAAALVALGATGILTFGLLRRRTVSASPAPQRPG